MAGGHRHSLYVERSLAGPPPRAGVQGRWRRCCSSSPWCSRGAKRSGRSRSTRRSSSRSRWPPRVAAGLAREAAACSSFRSSLFALFLPFVGGGAQVDVGPSRCRSPGCGVHGTSSSRARSALPRRRLLAGTTSPPELLPGLDRLRVPKVAGVDHDVHDPLPGGDRRRHAPDAHRRGCRAATTRAGSGRPRRSPRRPAHCSSAPTSAASGCTSRCWPWLRRQPSRLPTRSAPRAATGSSRSSVAGDWLTRPCVAVRARDEPHRVNDVDPRDRTARVRLPRRRQALLGVDLTVRAGSGWPCSGRTAPARRRSCCTSTASSAAARHGRGRWARVEKQNLAEIRRRVGIVFQDPDDQLFMPTVRDDVAFGPANLGLRGAELEDRVATALAAVGMADRSRPAAAPPQLRPAPARGGRDRAGHGPRDPRPRRAIVEPRSRRPPGARRDRARPRPDDADGDARSAVRAAAVPALGDPRTTGVIVADGPTRAPRRRQ